MEVNKPRIIDQCIKTVVTKDNNSYPVLDKLINIENTREVAGIFGSIISSSGYKVLLETLLLGDRIELIYQVTKNYGGNIKSSDEYFKDIYIIENGAIVFLKTVKGKYVPPIGPKYSFDE